MSRRKAGNKSVAAELVQNLFTHDQETIMNVLQMATDQLAIDQAKSVSFLSQCPFRDDRKHQWDQVRKLLNVLGNTNCVLTCVVNVRNVGPIVISSDPAVQLHESNPEQDVYKVTVCTTGTMPLRLATNTSAAQVLGSSTAAPVREFLCENLTEIAKNIVEYHSQNKRRRQSTSQRSSVSQTPSEASLTDTHATALSSPATNNEADTWLDSLGSFDPGAVGWSGFTPDYAASFCGAMDSQSAACGTTESQSAACDTTESQSAACGTTESQIAALFSLDCSSANPPSADYIFQLTPTRDQPQNNMLLTPPQHERFMRISPSLLQVRIYCFFFAARC